MMLTTLRKLSRRIARTAYIAVICVMSAYSPVASSVQITLGTNMKVRTSGDDGLTPVAVLRKGSVVEVPDRYKVVKNGKVDAEATFNKWLRDAGFTNPQINKRVRDQKQDFYFPIRIVSVAGKPKSKLKGRTLFMALRVLERSRGGLRVKEDSPAYNGSSLKPLRGLPRVAPAARPARSAELNQLFNAPAPTEAAAPAAAAAVQPEETQTQDDPPVYTPEARAEDGDQTETTEASDPSADCATCNLPQNPVDGLSATVRDQLSTVDRTASRGLQGLTSQFPANCRDGRFIQSDGSYGSLGEEILKQIRRHPYTFMRDGAARAACPNFDRFDQTKREHFWVYLMTAVFAKESTCRSYAPAMGPDGALAGLGQMPADQNRNAADNRSGGWGSDCSGNMSNATNNIRCSVRRLESLVDNGAGPYAKNGNYWSTLRSESRGMTKALISQYDDCGASEFSVAGGRRSGKSHRRHHGRRR